MVLMSAPSTSSCKHLEPKMDKFVVEDYYRMTILDESVN